MDVDDVEVVGRHSVEQNAFQVAQVLSLQCAQPLLVLLTERCLQLRVAVRGLRERQLRLLEYLGATRPGTYRPAP